VFINIEVTNAHAYKTNSLTEEIHYEHSSNTMKSALTNTKTE